MAKILVFQHVAYEPLGTLDPLIRSHNHRIRYVNFSREPDANPDVAKYDGLIVLGGPMNVDNTKEYSFLLTEMRAIEKALQLNKPILGICLGSQLLAAVLGSKVYPANEKEVGWYALSQTQLGRDDSLIAHWKSSETIFQWHGYTFDCPKEADLLVSGQGCQNQAFRVNDNAYGFQFHLEVTAPLIERWLNVPIHQVDLNAQSPEQHQQQIRNHTKDNIIQSEMLSQKVFNSFLDLLPKVDRHIVLPSR